VVTLNYPVLVRGDRDKLKQVFINLVTNAQEACDPGSVVTWMVYPPAEGKVTVSVHNQGAPIPPEVLPQITQPFFTTKPSGNGLGLAITKRIVEAHQGHLAIASSAELGTEVTVILPLAEA
jgi:signal transduction histidine kinase